MQRPFKYKGISSTEEYENKHTVYNEAKIDFQIQFRLFFGKIKISLLIRNLHLSP
jgi:hypothetical protein